MSVDPVKDGLNWYVYAVNNPLRFVDPLGLAAGDEHHRREYWGLSDDEVIKNQIKDSLTEIPRINNFELSTFDWLYENKYFDYMYNDIEGIIKIAKIVLITAFLNEIGKVEVDYLRDFYDNNTVLWTPNDNRHPILKFFQGTPRYRINLETLTVEHEIMQCSVIALPIPIDLSSLLMGSSLTLKMIEQLSGLKNVNINNLSEVLINLAISNENEIRENLSSENENNSNTVPPDNDPDDKKHTPDQEALTKLAKEAKQQGGVNQIDAETLVEWGEEVGLSSRGPEVHPNRPFGQNPHIHVGPVDHIPVIP